jgi:enoyl-[acyl-carrier protein] reductase I
MNTGPEWTTDATLSSGKGATFQVFTASVGAHRLEIDVAPWGEGHLRIDGTEIAHITDANSRYQAFTRLKQIANSHLRERGIDLPPPGDAPPAERSP